jgi:hypothetical protein
MTLLSKQDWNTYTYVYICSLLLKKATVKAHKSALSLQDRFLHGLVLAKLPLVLSEEFSAGALSLQD